MSSKLNEALMKQVIICVLTRTRVELPLLMLIVDSNNTTQAVIHALCEGIENAEREEKLHIAFRILSDPEPNLHI